MDLRRGEELLTSCLKLQQPSSTTPSSQTSLEDTRSLLMKVRRVLARTEIANKKQSTNKTSSSFKSDNDHHDVIYKRLRGALNDDSTLFSSEIEQEQEETTARNESSSFEQFLNKVIFNFSSDIQHLNGTFKRLVEDNSHYLTTLFPGISPLQHNIPLSFEKCCRSDPYKSKLEEKLTEVF